VEIWDLLTGLCKASFQSPATKHYQGDAKLISGRLVFAWKKHYDPKLHIWDSENSNSPEQIDVQSSGSFIVSGDGSKVFYEGYGAIRVWSVQTREIVGEVIIKRGKEYLDPLHVDGSRLWVRSQDLSTQGWDFGVPNSPPALLPNIPSEKPHLDFIYGSKWGTGPCIIVDTTTGKKVFRLVGKHAKPQGVKWDGRYLVAQYDNTDKVLILDFGHMHS